MRCGLLVVPFVLSSVASARFEADLVRRTNRQNPGDTLQSVDGRREFVSHAGPDRIVLRLLPLGDSITAGVGDRTDFGGYRGPLYRALYADGFDVRLVGSQTIGSFEQPACEAHPGWTIEQIHIGVDSGWIEAVRPDAVLLTNGTNDLFLRPEGAVARLSALVDDILTRDPALHLFVATIPPSGDKHIAHRVAPFNFGLRRLVEARRAKGERIVFVDVNSSLEVSQMRDGVHPNAEAYARIAERWHRALRESFPPPPPRTID